MSFVSDELANVLKSIYMAEESGGKDEDDDSPAKVDKKNEEVSKEKRSRKHKHKKHSKSKKKHRKRKHRSRSSESRSRSRSRSNERDSSLKQSIKRRSLSSSSRSKSVTPELAEEIEHDFVLEKEKSVGMDGDDDKSDTQDSDFYGADTTICLSKAASEEKPNCDQEVCESKTLDVKGIELESSTQNVSSDKIVGSLNDTSTTSREEKDRSRSRSRSKGKVNDSKRKKSASYSRSRSKSPDAKSSRNSKKRHSRSRSKDQKTKRKSRSLSSSKKKSRSRSRSKNKSSKRRSKSRSLSSSKKKSKSRSRSRSKNKSSKRKSKSKSRSKERHRKKSFSKSRSRSRSYSSRSRSPRRRRSRSRSRRKSPAFRPNFRRFSNPRWQRGRGSFRRGRSRSRSRTRRSRSRRRSSSRRRQSRSRSRGRRSRSRSRSRLRNRRSRSVSRDRRRKRSRSNSRSGRRSTSRDKRKSKSRSRSKSTEKVQLSNTLPTPSAAVANRSLVSGVIDKPVAGDLSTQQVKVAQRAGGKSIAELTAFCKKLQEEKESVDNNGTGAAVKTEEEDSQPVAHHPFLVKEKPDITIPAVIFPVNRQPMLTMSVDPSKPLQEQFPVSCGSKHREKETVNDGAGVVADVDGSAIQTQPKVEVFAQPPVEKFDISELVAKRMDSQRRLQSDPNDIEALLTLQEIQMKMQNWCQSNVKPGQFTGELVKNLLPKENLQGGFQAWVKKDMFHNLAPVSGGIGMKLLQKMGWKPGQVIGKRGEGYAEPITVTVKIDRKGLSAGKEKASKKGAPSMSDLQGKHPVSALAEYCSKRKWQLPDYSLIFDHGPAHHKQFLFKVLVNSIEYQPAVVCGNKKQAKAQAAIYALKGLGLIPEDAVISAV